MLLDEQNYISLLSTGFMNVKDYCLFWLILIIYISHDLLTVSAALHLGEGYVRPGIGDKYSFMLHLFVIVCIFVILLCRFEVTLFCFVCLPCFHDSFGSLHYHFLSPYSCLTDFPTRNNSHFKPKLRPSRLALESIYDCMSHISCQSM